MENLKEVALKSYTNLVSFFPLLSTEDMKDWRVLSIIKNANNLFNLLSILKDESDVRLPDIILNLHKSTDVIVSIILTKYLSDIINNDKELNPSVSTVVSATEINCDKGNICIKFYSRNVSYTLYKHITTVDTLNSFKENIPNILLIISGTADELTVLSGCKSE